MISLEGLEYCDIDNMKSVLAYNRERLTEAIVAVLSGDSSRFDINVELLIIYSRIL